MVEMPPWLIAIELGRELCTLLMLGGVAWISGKTFLKRLSVFLFIFGIWDILYYIALKIFLDWPDSLFTWDILFMIPITWTGPVLAPVICSVIMIVMALLFDYFQERQRIKKLQKKELLFLFAGAFIIYFTFTFDTGMIVIKGHFLSKFFSLAENPDFQKLLISYIPSHFSWGIFSLGIAIILLGLFLIVKRGILKGTKQE